jgi:hypothetical protein
VNSQGIISAGKHQSLVVRFSPDQRGNVLPGMQNFQNRAEAIKAGTSFAEKVSPGSKAGWGVSDLRKADFILPSSSS